MEGRRTQARDWRLPPRVVAVWYAVHTWSGVLSSLVLAAMFLGGSVSLFRRPLEIWQAPPAAGDRATIDRLAAEAIARRSPAAGSVGVAVAGASPRAVLYLPGADGEMERVEVDPERGRVDRATSRVADVFYQLHFLWHDAAPIGMLIAGLLGIVFLLAVVTGVAIHLKNLRRQLARFRPAARVRSLWSDLHKVLGVWGLPFQLTIAFTGSLICVLGYVAPHIGLAAFDGDRAAAEAELWGPTPPPPAPGPPWPSLGFTELAARGEQALPGMQATYVDVAAWNRLGAVATVYGIRPGDGVYPEVHVRLRARDGALIEIDRGEHTTVTHDGVHLLYGLHFADYGGPALRLLYLVLGLAGWMTILSGNWIWIQRRRARGSRGAEALARLTLGLGGGILVAGAAIFWINRLAPVDADRPALEAYGFTAAWAATALAAATRPARLAGWVALLCVVGGGLVLVPLLSAASGPAYAGAAGRTAALVDLGIAGAGALALLAAAVIARRARAGRIR